ncbi:hypothetical protein [uncultured Hyphomonas sp.]|uniref:hypothetical protein n=1 Tax=uncultured Hyphomonas sp. TaxID=225298 RepID=UPI002AAAABB3|nr:hypothetical protein [uncultured Hyphomonas sp.]
MRDVYISSTGIFLPGDPVPSDEMVDYIGSIDKKSPRLGDFVLRLNGIKTRHYAIDKSQNLLHSNAEMAANAVRNALAEANLDVDDLQMLNTATTMGDLIVPGHASAVHGELGGGPMDIASFQSVCASAMMAVKSAWVNVGSGLMDNAVAVGSELPSIRFRPAVYQPALECLQDRKARMSAEFLRWTLSDGAGAAVFEAEPRGPMSYRVDHIVTRSFAHVFDTCMYAGAAPGQVHDLKKNWSAHAEGVPGAVADGAVMLLQDMPLLKEILRVWANEVAVVAKEGFYDPETLDWMLCHYSAESLRDEVAGYMREAGADIAMHKWWSDLSYRGNMGAASTFVLLHDFLRSGEPKPGDKVFCLIPESGRALVSFMFLTVV